MRTKSVIGRMKCIKNTGHVEERGKGGGASSLQLWGWPRLRFREGRGGEGGRDGDDGVSSLSISQKDTFIALSGSCCNVIPASLEKLSS
jgi:hypothetical protein